MNVAMTLSKKTLSVAMAIMAVEEQKLLHLHPPILKKDPSIAQPLYPVTTRTVFKRMAIYIVPHTKHVIEPMTIPKSTSQALFNALAQIHANIRNAMAISTLHSLHFAVEWNLAWK